MQEIENARALFANARNLVAVARQTDGDAAERWYKPLLAAAEQAVAHAITCSATAFYAAGQGTLCVLRPEGEEPRLTRLTSLVNREIENVTTAPKWSVLAPAEIGTRLKESTLLGVELVESSAANATAEEAAELLARLRADDVHTRGCRPLGLDILQALFGPLEFEVGEKWYRGGSSHHSGEASAWQLCLPTGEWAIVAEISNDCGGSREIIGVTADAWVPLSMSGRGASCAIEGEHRAPTPQDTAFVAERVILESWSHRGEVDFSDDDE